MLYYNYQKLWRAKHPSGNTINHFSLLTELWNPLKWLALHLEKGIISWIINNKKTIQLWKFLGNSKCKHCWECIKLYYISINWFNDTDHIHILLQRENMWNQLDFLSGAEKEWVWIKNVKLYDNVLFT